MTALGIPHEASSTAAVVTVSVGWASVVPVEGMDPEALVAAADEAMYEAKITRNAVCGRSRARGDGNT